MNPLSGCKYGTITWPSWLSAMPLSLMEVSSNWFAANDAGNSETMHMHIFALTTICVVACLCVSRFSIRSQFA